MTNKQKVLRRYPKAYAKFVGLSMHYVIVNDFRGAEISGWNLRERDAWASAARSIKAKP